MPGLLHLTNGDSMLPGLRAAGVEGEIVSWRDALDDRGDVPRVVDHGGEFVLWFEADLFDQLQLVEILARLAELGTEPGRITLYSVGEHVDVARFGGMGELSGAQL